MANHISNGSLEAIIGRGMESYRRLEAKGYLRLHNGERQYTLTAGGKARVGELIGHPVLVRFSEIPDLVSAMEAWLRRHDAEDTDDRALVMAAATVMEANGVVRLKFGGWR